MSKTTTFKEIDHYMNYLRIPYRPDFSEIRVMRIEEVLQPRLRWQPTLLKGLFYQLSFSESFRGTIIKDQQKLDLEEAFLGFVSPFHTITMQPLPNAWHGYALFFTLGFADFSLWNSQTRKDFPFLFNESRPALPIKKSKIKQYRNYFQNLYNTYNTSLGNKEEILQNTLRDLIWQIKEDFPLPEPTLSPATNNPQRILAAKFIKMTNQLSPDFHQTHFYAEALNVSYHQLYYCVKKYWGKGPSEIIQEKLLTEAKVLLKDPFLSISDIAFQLNFEELSHFSRFFKKHTGISPSEYLKKIRPQ